MDNLIQDSYNLYISQLDNNENNFQLNLIYNIPTEFSSKKLAASLHFPKLFVYQIFIWPSPI